MSNVASPVSVFGSVNSVFIPKKIEIYRDGQWKRIDPRSLKYVPHMERMKITPEFAQDVLEHRNKVNRPINKIQVNKYARIMSQGKWKFFGQIVFNEDGYLFNGQHRFSAIVKSNKTIEFCVLFGATDDYICAMDEGRKRSDCDAAKMLRKSFGRKEMAAARYILQMRNKGTHLTREEHLDFCEEHIYNIRLVTENLVSNKFANGPVHAAVVCASYHTDEDTIIDFCHSLDSGLNQTRTDPIWLLRNYIINYGVNYGGTRADVYRKTEKALEHFINGEQRTKLRVDKKQKELFPVPGLDY